MGLASAGPISKAKEVGMKATITKAEGFRCAPDGSIIVHFKQGELVEGRAAEFALRNGAAKPFDPREEAKVETVLEVKATPRRTRKKGSD